jgi:triphosphoribosyl-dephospho-CoA synthase
VACTTRPRASGTSEPVITATRLDPLTPTTIAALAVRALQEEALLSPKPGLVDRRGSGSHSDMDLPMLLRSAESLQDTFRELALAGSRFPIGQHLRDRIGVLGRMGEATMLEATGGVNTHRGALWTVGLLVTAAGSARAGSTTAVVDVPARAGALARIPDSAGDRPQSSHGQRAMRAYGVRGAAGEASAGFPSIARVALPTLRASRSHGEGEDRARLRALLALVAAVDDTCVLHRGGSEGLRWLQRSARRVQRARRFDSALERLVVRTERRGLSPGGSADLLAGAVFLDSLDRSRDSGPIPVHSSSASREPVHAHL